MYDNKKLALSVFWMAAGIALIVLSIMEVLDSSLFSGMGGALFAVGSLQTIRNLRYRKDPEYREKIDTEISDERNRFLSMKSWSWTGTIVIIAESVAAIVAMVLGERTVQLTLCYSVCLMLASYWISYLILGKKY